MAAFARGEDPSILAATVARAATTRRKGPTPRSKHSPKKSWWETYSSLYPTGRYHSSNTSKTSDSQNIYNYRRELNNKIYNSGRVYGKQYQF